MTIYDYEAKLLGGDLISLKEFEGKVLLIVNTASKCGFTPQYAELQELYEDYKDEGFEILGFPCDQFMNQEPGTDEEIALFCSENYGVTFPMFKKVKVLGPEAHPLYVELAKRAPGVLGTSLIKWNFTKFLVDRSGEIIRRYSPQISPKELQEDIHALLEIKS